ncbi:MAG: ABC transporter ATP-binding protein [Nitrososphaeraceae archaeon]|nr:ABC transporter ATP-binding protein [Nitrososphaeraceae archaeon]
MLLGPSGCGKTTIIRCIAGLIDPDEGQIFIGDKLVNRIAPKDRDVAVVFQNYALYPHMTVYDNIAFPLKMRKLSKEKIQEKVIKISKVLEISELLKRKPRELSGGQMQRVALGRALVREPKVFLLDEPLSNLDSKLRIQMRTEIKKLQKKVGVTTIYITHDQIEAMGMGDRIAILNNGVIQQIGTPEEVYKNPQNLFVANFIGNPQINILRFEILRSNHGKFISINSKNSFVEVSDQWLQKFLNDSIIQNISIGIRPKDISRSIGKNSDSMRFKGKLSFIERLGDETIFEFMLLDESVIHVVNSTLDTSSLKIGSDLILETEYDNILLFDSDTGNRIYQI